MIPYAQGICERIKNICGKHGIAVHFKGGQILKNILVSPKDKNIMANTKASFTATVVGGLTVMKNI